MKAAIGVQYHFPECGSPSGLGAEKTEKCHKCAPLYWQINQVSGDELQLMA